MSPVRAPVRSVSALMITVVPWTKAATPRAATPARRSVSRTPRSKWGGVVSALAVPRRPVASSRKTRSVKVPPMSLATRICAVPLTLLPQKILGVTTQSATAGSAPGFANVCRLREGKWMLSPAARRWGVPSMSSRSSPLST